MGCFEWVGIVPIMFCVVVLLCLYSSETCHVMYVLPGTHHLLWLTVITFSCCVVLLFVYVLIRRVSPHVLP